MMKIISVKSPCYDPNGTITALVCFVGSDEHYPFTASADDEHEHGRQLYADLTAGKYGAVASVKDDHLRQIDENKARSEQAGRYDEATAIISPLAQDAVAGTLDNQGRKRLAAWSRYRQQISAIDPSSLQVTWPTKPE